MGPKDQKAIGGCCAGWMLLLLFCFVAFIAMVRFSNNNQPQWKHQQNFNHHSDPDIAASSELTTGSTAYLALGSDRLFFLPIDEDAQAEMTRHAVNGSEAGLESMVEAGTLLEMPRNTEVIITNAGVLSHSVRVTAGRHKGRNGIASVGHVHATRKDL